MSEFEPMTAEEERYIDSSLFRTIANAAMLLDVTDVGSDQTEDIARMSRVIFEAFADSTPITLAGIESLIKQRRFKK